MTAAQDTVRYRINLGNGQMEMNTAVLLVKNYETRPLISDAEFGID